MNALSHISPLLSRSEGRLPVGSVSFNLSENERRYDTCGNQRSGKPVDNQWNSRNAQLVGTACSTKTLSNHVIRTLSLQPVEFLTHHGDGLSSCRISPDGVINSNYGLCRILERSFGMWFRPNRHYWSLSSWLPNRQANRRQITIMLYNLD